MAKKAEEKVALKDLTLDDLKLQLAEHSEKIYKLKFKHSVAPIKNPIEIRNLKRDRARILTWMRQKELAKAASPAKTAVKASAKPAASTAKKKG